MESHNFQDGSFALTINTDLCGECVFCLSACPFEALSRDEETKIVKIDQDKCRLCGICYTACPSSLISITHYNIDSLTDYLQKKVEEEGAQQLTIACRGTALTPGNWQEKLGDDDGIETAFFTLPCLGRIHLNFLLNALELGIEKISLICCEEDFCRNKEGSKIACNKVDAAQLLFEDMGYYADMIEFDTRAPRAQIEEKNCIACGTCAFLCPYDAITIETSAKLDLEKCMGCGICVSSCPAIAITLEGSSSDRIGKEIADFAARTIDRKILVLGCQWSEYIYVDKTENGDDTEKIKFLRMPCSGRIDVLHVLKALRSGIDGILLSICTDDICSLETGNKWTKARVSYLKKLLEVLGLGHRVGICSAHPKYLGQFENELKEFVQKIDKLDANPLKGVLN